MAEKPKQQDRTPSNEGKGGRTAARQYNEAQRRFAQSGKVDKQERGPSGRSRRRKSA
jgi:hypothetical protein